MPAKLKQYLAVLLLAAFSSPGQCAGTYSLDDCLRAAAANNTDLRSLALNRDSANLTVNSALYDLFPQVNAVLGYSDSSVYDYKLNARTANSGYTGTLSVTQSLYSGGRNTAAYKKAKNSYRLADYDWRDKLASLTMTVKQYYFQALQNAELVKTGRGAVERKEHNYSLIKLLYQGGNEKITNVEQAEYNVEKAKLDLLQTEKNSELALLHLKQTIGLDAEEPLELETGAQSYGRELTMTESEAVSAALAGRVDIKKAAINLESNELERTAAKSEFLPSASVSAAYDRRGKYFFPEQNSWTTGLTLSLPLSGGFPLYTSLKQNKLNRSSLNLEKENLIKNITYQTRSAHISLAMSRIRVNLAKKNLTIAKDRSTLANLEYSQGSISFIEFEDIEDNLSSAESGLVEAAYSYENAKAAFEYYIGASPI